MVKYRFWVTTSHESAASLQSQNTDEGDAECLLVATLSCRHTDETWGARDIVPALEHGDRIREVDIFDIPSSQLEKCFSSDAAAIPGADKLPLGHNDEMAPIVSQCVLEWPRLQQRRPWT
jgi:hypothetical protein